MENLNGYRQAEAVAELLAMGRPEANDWMEQGACRNENPEFFYSEGNRHSEVEVRRLETAKAICQRCPVIAKCADYAIANTHEQGIWGGLTEDERRAFRRRAARGQTQRAG